MSSTRRQVELDITLELPTACSQAIVAVIDNRGQPILLDRVNVGRRMRYQRTFYPQPHNFPIRTFVIDSNNANVLGQIDTNNGKGRGSIPIRLNVNACSGIPNDISRRLINIYDNRGEVTPQEVIVTESTNWLPTIIATIIILAAMFLVYWFLCRRRAAEERNPLLFGQPERRA